MQKTATLSLTQSWSWGSHATTKKKNFKVSKKYPEMKYPNFSFVWRICFSYIFSIVLRRSNINWQSCEIAISKMAMKKPSNQQKKRKIKVPCDIVSGNTYEIRSS